MDARHRLLGIVIGFLLFCAVVGTASAKTIYVDDSGGTDFTTIRDAINATSAGDTIIVKEGVYKECVDVNNRLTIRSENGSTSCIVQAAHSDAHVFEVRRDWVNISGFTIRGAIGEPKVAPMVAGFYAGIYLDDVDCCNISDNVVLNSDYGIELSRSISNTLTNNSVNSNTRYGIYLSRSSGSTMTNNTISGNRYNFGVHGDRLSHFIHNIDTSNKVDEKTIYYLVGQHDQQIPNDAGFVALINATNISVRDSTLTNNRYGVILIHTTNSKIENVNASNNEYGIWLENSRDNLFTNSIINLSHTGIYLVHSNNNTITNNIVSNSKGGTILADGIYVSYSSNLNIANNILNSNNGYGIHLDHSSTNCKLTNNTIHSNRGSGIALYSGSSNNVVANNTFINDGLFILDYKNIVKDNTVNGKPLVYLKDVSGQTITDAGQVILVNCDNITVENLNLSYTATGVALWKSCNTTIVNNTANSNDCYGIHLSSSNNNTITNNTANSNYYGIYLHSLSTNNTLANNTANSNRHHGINLVSSSSNTLKRNIALDNSCNNIYLYDSNNNLLADNIVSNSDYGLRLRTSSDNILINNTANGSSYYGIHLFDRSCDNIIVNNIVSSNNEKGILLSLLCDNNLIYLNSFINNNKSVDIYRSTSTWNSTEMITYTHNGNTYSSYLGNYWDDYTGDDANKDGIGDTPYSPVINAIVDNYPLIPYFENSLTLSYPIQTVKPTTSPKKPSPIEKTPVEEPGFETIFVIVGLFVVAYLLRRRG